MARENLTDRRLKNLKPAEPGKRYELSDAIVPGLIVRVTDSGTKTFCLVARYPGRGDPARRKIGYYAATSLEDARRIAREWIELIRKGTDPQVHLAEVKAKELDRQQETFRSVVARYLNVAVFGMDKGDPPARNKARPIKRSAKEIARSLEVEFSNDYTLPDGSKRKGLGSRPISGITRRDIERVIDDAVGRGSHSMARTLLAHAKMLFAWGAAKGISGMETSPADRIKPNVAIPKRSDDDNEPRDRVLDELEIRALWEASTKIGYPYGDLYRVLLLTGVRKNEAAHAPSTEIDLSRRMWTIPAGRMKMKKPHFVPLSDLAAEIISAMPKHGANGPLFSIDGRKPINGFSKAKKILDREMLAALKQIAESEGRNPVEVTLKPFTIHDIRRSVRTTLSELGVSELVGEMILAHTRKGIAARYAHHTHLSERREALERMAHHVLGLVEPRPDNVIVLPERRASVQPLITKQLPRA